MSVAQSLLAALEAAGETVEVVCPGCKAVVDLGEALANLLFNSTSTEAQQVSTAEKAILDADAAAVAALGAAHVNLTPSAPVQAAGAVAGAALAAGTSEPAAAEHAPVAGAVKSWT